LVSRLNQFQIVLRGQETINESFKPEQPYNHHYPLCV
jgi:hypothetical protein